MRSLSVNGLAEWLTAWTRGRVPVTNASVFVGFTILEEPPSDRVCIE